MTEFRVPSVETERLLLRPVTEADLDEVAAITFGDPDVIRYMVKREMTPRQRAERMYRNYSATWQARRHGGWVITDKNTGKIMGECELDYIDETDEVELGYTLAKAYWGKGIATEAGRATTRYGFETTGLKRIISIAVPANTASWKVMEHIGFVFQKEDVYYDLTVRCYQLFADQFDPGDHFYRVHDAPNA